LNPICPPPIPLFGRNVPDRNAVVALSGVLNPQFDMAQA